MITEEFELHSPWFLALFLLFIPLFIKDLKKVKNHSLVVPSIQGMTKTKEFWLLQQFLRYSKFLILSALILAMARPRKVNTTTLNQEGIDIILSVDISLSMLARDLKPDRLEALKNIAQDFVNQRTNDKIGLTIYSGEAFMRVPLTSDHQAIIEEIQTMSPGDITHGTSIPHGLAIATKHLINSNAKSKIIILMSDGVNTVRSYISQDDAIQLARNNNIKVYTIGIGTNGMADFPAITQDGELVFIPQEVEIDEKGLMEIAQRTGGKYFRATDNLNLEQIYNEINELEKSETQGERIHEYTEYFRYFLYLAFILLLIDAYFRWSFFKKLD